MINKRVKQANGFTHSIPSTEACDYNSRPASRQLPSGILALSPFSETRSERGDFGGLPPFEEPGQSVGRLGIGV